MSHKLNNLVLLCLLMSLGACGQQKSSKTTQDFRKDVQESQDKVQKALDDARKASDDAKKAGADAKDAQDAALNITASGGQPGKIVLSGAFVEADGSLIPSVSIEQKTGKSWKGENAKLESSQLELKKEIHESAQEELGKLEANTTFINAGCQSLTAADTEGLTEVKAVDALKSPIIKARKIFVCGKLELPEEIVLVSTTELFLSDVSLARAGDIAKMVAFSTKTLRLEGTNSVSTVSPDSISTLLEGPGVFFSALKISGSGKLSISTQGASYIAPSEASAASDSK